jgi:hypothetical protein
MISKNRVTLVNIDLIEIPSIFIENPPRQKKYGYIKSRCEILEGVDKPLQVTISKNKYLLQDGYIRYLVARELGFKLVPTLYNNKVIIHLKELFEN